VRQTKLLFPLLVSALLALPPILTPMSLGRAAAEIVNSETLYTRKAWRVAAVEFDDGAVFCAAYVGPEHNQFIIWSDAEENVSLEMYNTGWNFEDSNADVVLRIDRRPKWTLPDARLNNSSVTFHLDDSDASLRFLREIMRGNYLKLYSSSGSEIERYTLAGSSASINALIDCVSALASLDGDNNPFN